MPDLSQQWQSHFLQTIRESRYAEILKQAALEEQLGAWTKSLTAATVDTCHLMNWKASARGHKLDQLPVVRSEYLSLDVVAFLPGARQWCFPTAIVELENSQNFEFIEYALWKVLCVQAALRIVFCYRKNSTQGAVLCKRLAESVIHSMPLTDREKVQGQTMLVIGSKNDSDTFPYGFFRWWLLDNNTSNFVLMR